MTTLEIRLRAEHKARLERFSQAATKHNSVPFFEVPPTANIASLPSIQNEQMEVAHEMFFKGGFTRIETIQRAVLMEFKGVTLADLKSRRRTANVVRPRQVAMYLAKEMTSQSLPDIGRRFGGRDHTTVIHAVAKIRGKVHSDMHFAAMIKRIMTRVEMAQ